MDNDQINAYLEAHREYTERQTRKPVGTKRQSSEWVEQEAFFGRVRHYENRYPDLRYVFAVPNGACLPKRQNQRTGEWYCSEAFKLKKGGLRAGVPDILFPKPAGKFYGLAIEMKSEKGTPSGEQKEWIEALQYFGWRAEICRSADNAWAVLVDYLGLKI